jgi:hypothetical protein
MELLFVSHESAFFLRPQNYRSIQVDQSLACKGFLDVPRHWLHSGIRSSRHFRRAVRLRAKPIGHMYRCCSLWQGVAAVLAMPLVRLRC